VCDALEEDKNDVNEGVEEDARVCAALAGATGKEGIVVERTTYGQYGRCSLSKSICRAFGGIAVLSSVVRLARGVEIIAQSPSRLWHKEQCKSEASLRWSGVTLPRGLHGVGVSGNEVGVLVWVVLLLRAEGRRGVRGGGGVKENSAGATEEARDKKGEGVVDWGCTDDTRDQPNNDVRMALEDGPGGGASFCIDDSSSGGFSSPVFSSAGNSAPTDAITDRRALTWVEDCIQEMR
jgi:hypothetical protein